MKKSIILLMALCAASAAIATVTQRVHLKNGTILNGYIQQQDKNDNITFRSESAVINIDGKDAIVTDRNYSLTDLSPQWVKWAEENDAFSGIGDNRYLTLSDISFDPFNIDIRDSVLNDKKSKETFEINLKGRLNSVSKVKLLQKGATIKYVDLSPNTYTFNWSEVEAIEADRRPRTLLSGIDRTYQLRNGREVKGQYAGETYTTLSLYDDNGTIETFNLDDVTRYLYNGINPAQDIFEQSPLLDIVSTKEHGYFKGIIVERNFNKDAKYLRLHQQNGASQLLKFADITGYSNEENPSYSPVEDIILAKGVVLINRTNADSVGVKKIESRLVLDSINAKIVVARTEPSTRVIVEYNNEAGLSADHLILVKVDKSLDKKKQPFYSFTTDIYEMQKFMPIKHETSVNNTTRTEYVVTASGVYALYDVATRRAMPFIVR